MPYHTYPAQTPTNTRVATTTTYVPHAAVTMGGVGAIVGGTNAAAKNIRQVKAGEINQQEAVGNVIKEAAGAGVATAAATAVVGSLGPNRGLLSLLGVLVLATGTKYFWDEITGTDKK